MNGKNIFAFLLGAGAGAAISYYLTAAKYEQILQDEIESAKEYYRNKYGASDDVESDSGNDAEGSESSDDSIGDSKPDLQEYAERIKREGYTDYAAISGENPADKLGDLKEEEEQDMNEPYIITEDQFNDEHDDYEKLSMSYYANGVLTDDYDEPVEDPDRVVGMGALNAFGDAGVDSVYVRNNVLKCDYEILRDQRKYEEEDD